MRIRVQSAVAADLLEFLRRADCRAERIDDETVEVDVPAALRDDQARMELNLYLKAWLAANPEMEAQLIEPRTSVEDASSAAD